MFPFRSFSPPLYVPGEDLFNNTCFWQLLHSSKHVLRIINNPFKLQERRWCFCSLTLPQLMGVRAAHRKRDSITSPTFTSLLDITVYQRILTSPPDLTPLKMSSVLIKMRKALLSNSLISFFFMKCFCGKLRLQPFNKIPLLVADDV